MRFGSKYGYQSAILDNINHRIMQGLCTRCKDCLGVYTGETEGRYSMREKEHQRDVRSLEEVKFIHARKKELVSEFHPSAITDHVTRNNHTIDWEGVKFPSRDCDTIRRDIWESIAIKKTGAHALNHDGGDTNFHHATPSCCHVTPEACTDDSRP